MWKDIAALDKNLCKKRKKEKSTDISVHHLIGMFHAIL
jgi:hypothetical protein